MSVTKSPKAKPTFSGLSSKVVLSAMLCIGIATYAFGQDVRFDTELDPIAYALNGYSLHVGLNVEHMRYELGAYAADIPQWAQSNAGFRASSRGIGAKAQYYFADGHTGWFTGVSIGPEYERLKDRNSGGHNTKDLFGVGFEAGYRIPLGSGFYVTPWGGVDYRPYARDVPVGNRLYNDRHFIPFATVHIGYLF